MEGGYRGGLLYHQCSLISIRYTAIAASYMHELSEFLLSFKFYHAFIINLIHPPNRHGTINLIQTWLSDRVKALLFGQRIPPIRL